jgi:hypothetical protein
MKKMKLNTILAITEDLVTKFKGLISDYIGYFKKSQGDFKGERSTYEPYADQEDFPNLRKNQLVVTTIDEKLKYMEEHSSNYINSVLTQEATNAAGVAKAELELNGKVFILSSNEILRLLNILNNFKLDEMYANIPVRSDSENWQRCSLEQYEGRSIWQTELMVSEKKTSETTKMIVNDPHAITNPNRPPVLDEKRITIIQGKQSNQRFSGEWTHNQRAYTLARLSLLKTALKEALSRANDVEVVESEFKAEDLFKYLHG